ncbi:MAG: sodium/proline symporter, partial [Myxococcota bacterium]|nr:sodium/proline symporter [Myxococcota bacterium]
AVASGRSAWLLLGFTGMAWKLGTSAVWAAVGYITVEFFLFWFYGQRLRRFSGRRDCVTLPDFFCARLGDPGGWLRGTLVVVILAFMLAYTSAQFVAGGKAFSASFGLSHPLGVAATAAIVLAYTVMGGFMAVALTDMVQALFMVVALLVLPWMAVQEAGGWSLMCDQLSVLDPTLVDPLSLGVGALVGFLAIGLGSPGNPHILARYMSIDDPAQLKWAAVVGTGWNILAAGGALVLGLAGRSLVPDVDFLPGADVENLYPVLAQQLLHPVAFGLVVASVFASIMSTADSQLLVAASSLVRDVYEKLVKRGESIDPERLVRLSRMVVAVLVVLGLLLGFVAKDLVFWLVLFAWAGLGAALGPTSILSLYWRRTTRQGVIAGLLTGT